MSKVRPKHTAEEQRQMAISAAEILLIEGGIDAISMRKIADKIGYAVGQLYKLFKDQDAILLGVSERTAALLFERLARVIEGQTKPHRKIRAVAHEYIRFALDNPHRWGLMFSHKIGPDSEVPESNEYRSEQLFRLVESLLAEYSPKLAKGDLRITATALWASVHGIAALAVQDKLSWSERDDPLLICDRMLRGFMTGRSARGSALAT